MASNVSIGIKDGKYVPPVVVDGVLITDKTDEAKIIAERQLTEDAIAALPPATTIAEAESRFRRIQLIMAGSTENLLADAAYSNVRNSGIGKVLENGRTGTITFGPNGSRRTVYDPITATPADTSPPVQPKIPTPTASGEPIVPTSTNPTVAAPTDDNSNGPNTISGTNLLINTGTQPGLPIQPRPNILDQFASYTYNLGWYALTPEQYAAVVSTTRMDISQWSLLVQSGGAAQQQNGITQQGVNSGQSTQLNVPFTVLATPNRNKYFTQDYYLDDLQIESTVTGANASQFSKISFKVSEPNGITLVPNLTYATRELSASSPINCDFCMVIKFYGWDIEGNLITDPTRNIGTPGATPTISNAVLTRYYPFTITNVEFKIDGKHVVYDIKCAPKNYVKSASTSLGSIPSNFELSGETVGQILSATSPINFNTLAGLAQFGRESTNTSAPPNAQTGGAVTNDPTSTIAATNSSGPTASATTFDPVNNIL